METSTSNAHTIKWNIYFDNLQKYLLCKPIYFGVRHITKMSQNKRSTSAQQTKFQIIPEDIFRKVMKWNAKSILKLNILNERTYFASIVLKVFLFLPRVTLHLNKMMNVTFACSNIDLFILNYNRFQMHRQTNDRKTNDRINFKIE